MSVLQCSLKSNRNILNVWMLGSITEICYFSFETKDMLFFIWMLYKMCTKTSLPLCSFVVNEFIKKERKRFFFFLLVVVVVQSLSLVLTLTPWTAAFQASLSFTIFWNLFKFMFIELVMLPNHLIHCCLLSPPALNISQHHLQYFQWVGFLLEIVRNVWNQSLVCHGPL